MRRWIALCLALAAGLSLSGCGGGGQKEGGVLAAASGLSPDAAAVSVDGREVPAWRYLYWLAYACDYIAASYDGGAVRWEDTADGTDLETYAADRALEGAALYATVENWAEDFGCALTEEDEAAMDREWAARTAQYGGEDAYLAELARLGLTRDQAEALSADAYLYRHLYERFSTQGSSLSPAEEDLRAFAEERGYVTGDHIWFSTATADSEEALAAVRSRAEEAFGKLNGSPDPLNDFAVLAATYSDEADRDQHPAGRTFSPGGAALPDACMEALRSLQEGQFSGVVEAEDGFYLLLRRPLDTEAVAPDYFDALLQAAAESADVSVTQACQGIDVSRFYEALTAARAALEAGT